MGRPRKVFSQSFRVVTDLDSPIWHRLQKACEKERVSARKLVRELIQSYLERPARRVVYEDPLLLERVGSHADYPVLRRQCIGWVEFSDETELVIRYDEPVNHVPNGREPAGPSFLKLPRRCVVDERRTTFP